MHDKNLMTIMLRPRILLPVAIPKVTLHRFKATVEVMFSIVHHEYHTLLLWIIAYLCVQLGLKLLQRVFRPEMKEVKQEKNPIRIRFQPWILFPVVGPQMTASTRYRT